MPPPREADRRHWWLAAVLVACALVAPLAATPLPPLLDYPNHLARMLVIARGASDPVLSSMYFVRWTLVPNLAMDLLVPPLVRVMPLDVAGRLFIALALLLPLAGVVLLHRALFRRRSYWPLAAALVAYNGLLFAGFLNFVVGVGLALIGTAAWVRQADSAAVPRLLTAAVLAIVMFFCHLMAVAFFGLMAAGFELERLWRQRAPMRVVVPRLASLALPFLPVVALFLAAPIGQSATHQTAMQFVKGLWWAINGATWRTKALGLVSPVVTYSLPLDLATAAAVALAYAAALAAGGARVSRGLLAVVLVCLLAYPLVPSVWLTGANIDWRLPILAGFLVFAAVDPAPSAARWRPLAGVAIAALLAARIGLIAAVWHGHDRDLADFARVVAAVPPGARVLVVTAWPAHAANQPLSRGFLLAEDATGNLGALVTIERDAFWPSMFTSDTLQPVHVRPAYKAVSVPQGVTPSYRDLTAPAARDLGYAPYLQDWRQHFDYVLLLRADARPSGDALLPDLLQPVAQAGIAALYRIRQ